MPASRASSASLALILAACGGAPATGLPEPVASQCGRYAAVAPEALSLCVGRAVRGVEDPGVMNQACLTLGTGAGACRTEWVLAHQNDRRDAVTLAGLCGGDADCAFLMIDQRPSNDVVEQIARCERFAGQFTESCVGHAANRWAAKGATDTSVIPAKYQSIAGVQWGLARGAGSCPTGTSPEFAKGCELGASGRGGEQRVQPSGPGH